MSDASIAAMRDFSRRVVKLSRVDPQDQAAGFWRRFDKARCEMLMLANSLADPDNAEWVQATPRRTIEANICSLEGIAESVNSVIQQMKLRQSNV